MSNVATGGATDREFVPMKSRRLNVPERRRAAGAALTEIIEEVCRHYAPSGARVEDCWEVGEAGDGVTLRVFLTGPMQGSWTDMATGARGDALDLVAWQCGLDAAAALAEAERFLGRNAAGLEPKDGDAGGDQMGLFGALPESGRRKRPARRSGKGRNTGPSRQAAPPHEPPDGGPAPRPGNEQAAPEGFGFTADDRQRLRKAAEDAAWLRSRHTIRLLDAEAHGRAKARRERRGRRWRRTGLKAAVVLALAVFGPVLGVMGEYRYGVVDVASVLGAELPGDARVLPGGDGG